MRFDILCMAGEHTHCPVAVILLGWANFVKALLAATLISALMRHSDGANFVVIVLVSERTRHVYCFILNPAAVSAKSIPIISLLRTIRQFSYVLFQALRTPIVFLWWSLFQEQPFLWRPHAHLSTWLSVGAIVFMLPAVIFYEIGYDAYV